MGTISNTTRIKLDTILAKNKDAEKGFFKAAEMAKDPLLRDYLLKKSKERRQYWELLSTVITKYYSAYDVGGSVLGNMHRTWMDIATLLSSDQDKTLLHEAIKGEKSSLKEYDIVLKNELFPSQITTVLHEQREQIKKNLSTIKSLEDLRNQSQTDAY